MNILYTYLKTYLHLFKTVSLEIWCMARKFVEAAIL